MKYIPKLIEEARLIIDSPLVDTEGTADLWASGSDGPTSFELIVKKLPIGSSEKTSNVTLRSLKLLGFDLTEETKKMIIDWPKNIFNVVIR